MSIIKMILLLSFLILVHEAGHFWAARIFKMKVSKFGFGLPIGPTLWKKQVGDVEVLVHAFLLGGYVAFPDDEKDSDLPADSQDRFINKPVWQRMIVISAGVIANVIAALFLVMITAAVWKQLPSGEYEIGINKIIASKGESVWNSGVKEGDHILKINGSDISSTYGLTLYAQNSKRYDGKVEKEFVLKNLEQLKKLNPNIDEKTPIKAKTVIAVPPVISEPELKIQDEMLKGYTLYKDTQESLSDAQIELRDKLKGRTTFVGDDKITLEDIAYAISDGLRPLNIVVKRADKEVMLNTIYPNEKGVIGISLMSKQVLTPTKDIKSVITGSGRYLWQQTYILCYGLWQLFTGKIPAKDLHGIVVIVKIGGDVIQNSGIFSGLLLTAMISMDLALINFLPIPALDGGHFMFLLIEQIRRKPLDEAALEKINTFFFLLLIVFMVLVIFNDIYALIKHQL